MIDVKILGVHGINTAKLARSTCVGSTNTDVGLMSLVGDTYNSYHKSVLEHIIIQYEVTASIGIISEYNRHKLVGTSQMSTRYAIKKMIQSALKDKKRNCFLPTDFFDNIIKECLDTNHKKEIVAEISHMIYSIISVLQDDFSFSNDDIKYLIPQGLTTRVIYTQTLPDLTHLLVRRLDNSSHIDARKVASMLYDTVKEYNIPDYDALDLLIIRIIRNIYHYGLVKDDNLWRLQAL